MTSDADWLLAGGPECPTRLLALIGNQWQGQGGILLENFSFTCIEPSFPGRLLASWFATAIAMKGKR